MPQTYPKTTVLLSSLGSPTHNEFGDQVQGRCMSQLIALKLGKNWSF